MSERIINKVYIASSSKFAKECAELAKWLELRYSIKITRKWWEHYIKDSPNFENLSNKEFFEHPQVRMIEALDFKAVSNCDLLIVYVENEHPLKGALAEYGYAKALNKTIIFLGKAEKSAMYSSVIHVESRNQLAILIERDQ